MHNACGADAGAGSWRPRPRSEPMPAPLPKPSWILRRRFGVDSAVTGLARILQHVFFRETEVVGIERIPRDAPLVFASNHTNSVMDAVLLLALPGAQPRLLGKSTLWSHPVMRPLVVLAGALPVFRRQDPGVDVAGNFSTFARCHDALAARINIALFPEGTSHNERYRLPLKTGAARIVLEAEARRGPLGIRIVPVGLNYEAKDRFRSRVRVHVGHPIDPAAEIARYATEPGAAVRALTARIADGLDTVIGGGSWPERTLATPKESGAWRRAIRLLGLPVYAVGVALNWIPYRVPGWISDRISKTPDEPATYKLLAGLLAFPLFWFAEAALALHLAGAVAAFLVAIAAPLSGYAALRFSEERGAR
jgi:1-acyl-sn-glycerol-3-phosphate acyltransferase